MSEVFIKEEALQALLEKGVSFKGELRFQGTARISGRFEGQIYGETLILEPSAQVEAQVEVEHLIVLGSLSGIVKASKSALMEPPAQFRGEVITPVLTIKEGVSFEGSSKKREA